MSADVCQKHQSPDTHDDPCLYCALEEIKTVASRALKRGEILTKDTALDSILQLCKNRLLLRKALLKG